MLFTEGLPLVLVLDGGQLSLGIGLDQDVGLDADLLDGATARQVVQRRRQAQARPVVERDDGLDRALAEGLTTQHQRPVVILQRSRDDFGGRRTSPIDEHDHGILGFGALAFGVPLHVVAAVPPLGEDDHALLEEEIRDPNRLLQQPARVIA